MHMDSFCHDRKHKSAKQIEPRTTPTTRTQLQHCRCSLFAAPTPETFSQLRRERRPWLEKMSGETPNTARETRMLPAFGHAHRAAGLEQVVFAMGQQEGFGFGKKFSGFR